MTDKLKNIVVTVIFILFIFGILVINILSKDSNISKTERRKLAQFPQINLSKIFDKSFSDEFDKYTMDQFVKRDDFRQLKTFIELNIFRKKDVNNIYSKNGILIKQEYPLNEKSIENICNKINDIQKLYLNETNSVYYTIVPDKNYFMDDEYLKLDYSKLVNMMNNSLKDMTYINIFNKLKLEDYYSTDTHWKQEFLGNVLDEIGSQMNFKDRITTSFETHEITKFDGVYKGQLQVKTNQDYIKVLTNNIISNSSVYNFETKQETKVYDMEKLNSIVVVDKYDIYLSGATPLLIITNNNQETQKELIVFRDSFGSSLIPLFIEGYKTITVIDTRYIATKYLKDFVEFDNKDVLFLYSTLIINNSSSLK